MLDECKGEKFEEVVRVFAIAVLRKEAKQRFGSAPGLSAAFAETLTTPENLSAEQRARLLPLLLAHSQHLQRQLSERNRSHERFRDQQQRLNQARTTLTERRKAVEERQDHLPLITPQEIEAIADHIKSAWSGDERWAETLLHGGPGFMDDKLREQDLHSELPLFSNAKQQERSSTPSLLADLNQRIKTKELRLEKWKKFHATLEKAQQGRKSEATVETKKEPILSFGAHQALQPSVLQNENDSSTIRTEKLGGKGMQLIEAMRSELAHLKRRPTRRRDSFDEPPGSFHWSAETPIVHEGVQMTTAVTQIASGYDCPGAEDTADIRSSAFLEDHFGKHDAASSTTKPSHASAGRDFYGDDSTSRLDHFSSFPTQKSSDDNISCPSGGPLPETVFEQSPGLTVARTISEHESITNGQEHSLPYTSESLPSSPTPKPANDLTIQKPKLRPDSPDSTPESPNSPPPLPAPSPKQRAPPLLERTRQSMALFSPTTTSDPDSFHQTLHPTTTRPRQNHSSQIFPVNPFQNPSLTPNHHQYQHHQHHQQQEPPKQQRSITPLNQLFSDQADYASVFKSRPKVAVSPPPSRGTSPERT